jgi:hypothetical protein
MAQAAQQPATFGQVVGLVNKLQQICTQLGDTAGNSILVDKLSSIVVVGGQVGPCTRARVRGRLPGPWGLGQPCCSGAAHPTGLVQRP